MTSTTRRGARLLSRLGALLLVTAPCAAQEDLYLDSRRDPADTEGSSVELTLVELTKTTSQQTFEDGESLELGRERKLEATWVRKVVEVTAGRATSVTLTFSAWTLREGKREDTCLSGQTIAFRQTGDRFTWTAPDRVKLSSAAKGFLERRAERLSRPLVSAFLASEEKPLFAGTTWAVHALKAARALLPPRSEPDPKRSNVVVELASLKGSPPVAKLQAQAALQLSVLPGTTTRITEGGLWQSGLELTWQTDRPRGDAASKHVARFVGAGEGEQPDGRRYTTKTDVELSSTLKVEPVE